jgi:methylisocitrate lyase
MRERRIRLRERISSGKPLVAVGATDALSARLIESAGFECVYIGSYATAASRFGLRDTGLLSLEQLVEQARTIVAAVAIPVIADAEGGFADPRRTVQAFEEAGVAAIHIEDHTGAGKHTNEPQTLRPIDEATARIRAAIDSRTDPAFVITARSDAFWVFKDLADTIRRLEAYAAAGADMVFPTLAGPAELAEVRRRIPRPAMIVDMPGRGLPEHEDAAIVLYYGFSVLTQFEALQKALQDFKATGAHRGPVEDFEKFLGY